MKQPAPACVFSASNAARVGREEVKMAGRGSTGNVIAALCSFFAPGLGQLLQGRVFAALCFFVASGVLWFFMLGWLVHLVAAIDAAVWTRRATAVGAVPQVD